jgi:hypothetical protein
MIEKLITTESLIRGALAISGELEQGLEPIGGVALMTLRGYLWQLLNKSKG